MWGKPKVTGGVPSQVEKNSNIYLNKCDHSLVLQFNLKQRNLLAS